MHLGMNNYKELARFILVRIHIDVKADGGTNNNKITPDIKGKT